MVFWRLKITLSEEKKMTNQNKKSIESVVKFTKLKLHVHKISFRNQISIKIFWYVFLIWLSWYWHIVSEKKNESFISLSTQWNICNALIEQCIIINHIRFDLYTVFVSKLRTEYWMQFSCLFDWNVTFWFWSPMKVWYKVSTLSIQISLWFGFEACKDFV